MGFEKCPEQRNSRRRREKRDDLRNPCVAGRSADRNSVNGILYDNRNNGSCVLATTSFGTGFN